MRDQLFWLKGLQVASRPLAVPAQLSRVAAAAVLLILACFAPNARSAGALAGIAIQNTAQVSYTVGASTVTTSSNTVSLTVAEILDVVVTLQSPVLNVVPGATSQALLFRVTNTGNGPEAFSLALNNALGGDEFDPVAASPSIYFDTDASGTLTAADTPYTSGNNDPLLAPDAGVNVLLVNNIPNGLVNADRGFSRLAATSRTGSGAPGTAFAGQGQGGTDAVVGTSGAAAAGTGTYLVTDIAVSAVKSATVVDQFGGARPIPGARITYQVVVTAAGSGTATASQFSDNVPANTTFFPGSMKLNNAVLTDVADADAGTFLTNPQPQVRVALGNLTQASGPQTITFAVTIN